MELPAWLEEVGLFLAFLLPLTSIALEVLLSFTFSILSFPPFSLLFILVWLLYSKIFPSFLELELILLVLIFSLLISWVEAWACWRVFLFWACLSIFVLSFQLSQLIFQVLSLLWVQKFL